jgi:PHD/YefM family antitoxin component YafN of YafNO toxin-antitoxin module
MKTAIAKELRNRASTILESVRKGDEVVITMRGKSIAISQYFKVRAFKDIDYCLIF